MIPERDISVKPKITFRCLNKDCELYDHLYDLSDVRIVGEEQPEELKDIALSALHFGDCTKCHSIGDLTIEHGGRTYRSSEELGASLHGMAKEYKLLQRIVEGGIGTQEDNERFQELKELLIDARCNH